MSGSRRSAVWTSPRVWLIVAALIALPFLAEFNARLTQSRELDAQQASLSVQIDTEQARHQALLALQAWVNSNVYVEHWARLARMGKPGEVAVVPVASQPSAPFNVRATTTNIAPNDILSEWWTAFFGEAH